MNKSIVNMKVYFYNVRTHEMVYSQGYNILYCIDTMIKTVHLIVAVLNFVKTNAL